MSSALLLWPTNGLTTGWVSGDFHTKIDMFFQQYNVHVYWMAVSTMWWERGGGWQQILRRQIWKIFHILLYTGKHWQLYSQLRPSSQKQKIAIILDFLKDFSDIYILVLPCKLLWLLQLAHVGLLLLKGFVCSKLNYESTANLQQDPSHPYQKTQGLFHHNTII